MKDGGWVDRENNFVFKLPVGLAQSDLGLFYGITRFQGDAEQFVQSGANPRT
mgnify:CR=1 FL=1